MKFWFKVCTNSLEILPIKVISETEEYLVIEEKNSYDNKTPIKKMTKDFTCFPTWDIAHNYVYEVSKTKLEECKKKLAELTSIHDKIKKLINPIDESMILYQVG